MPDSPDAPMVGSPELNAAVAAYLQKETDRDRWIVALSNNRSGSVATYVSAVTAMIGLLFAVIVPMDNVRVTATSTLAGIAAACFFGAMALGLTLVQWPQLLNKLPRDESATDYETRIIRETKVALTLNGYPLVAKFDEGYYLQRIRCIKERGTCLALVSTLGLLASMATFFAALHY